MWRRTLSLSWPIAAQQTFNTLMRTVDVIVTGPFSPAAVAAVGLAGTVLVVGAAPVAGLFTSEPVSLEHAHLHSRLRDLDAVLRALLPAVREPPWCGRDRVPFYARLTGTGGFSYVAGIALGYGLAGVYAGIVLSYA